jgi:hypothetical protein
MNGFESLEDALEALELAGYADYLDRPSEEAAYLDEEAGRADDANLSEVLRTALHEDYADALPEELEAAFDNILDVLSPAESVNFVKALRQIEKGASRTLADPWVGQLARSALPVAGGAVGTALGGPVGTGAGSALGNAVAKALPAGARPGTPAAARTAIPAHPGISPAAPVPAGTQLPAAALALMLTQSAPMLCGLLAGALQEHGRQTIDGKPVGELMSTLSEIFAEAAEAADELYYAGDENAGDPAESDTYLAADPVAPADRARELYARLVAAENERLAEAALR